MSDIVLGMIIGGVIGVVGSAVVAWVQGNYSLKSKREENLALQQQQSTQIQHEKDSELLSRLIARRSTYLEPLSSHLSALYNSINNYEKKLVEILTPYYRDSKGDEIRVPEVNKQEFMRQIATAATAVEAISTSRDKVWEASSPVADIILIEQLTALTEAITTFYKAHTEMNRSFSGSKKRQDWVYDIVPMVKLMNKIQVNVSIAHYRIESLLAGVDENDE